MKRIIAKLDGTLFEMCDNLKQLEFDDLDRSNISDVTNWGIISNRGNITCFDYNDTFAKIYLSNPTLSGKTVSFYIRNFSTDGYKVDKKIGTFKVTNTKYDRFTGQIELELSNGFEDWQNKTIALNLSEYVNKRATLYEIYEIVNTSISEAHSFSFSLTEKVEELFKSITIYVPYRIETVSVWSIINEICAMSMCRVLANVNGNPYFYNVVTSSSVKNILPNELLAIDLSETPQSNAVKSASVSVNEPKFVYSSLIGTHRIYLFKSATQTYDEYAVEYPLGTLKGESNKNTEFITEQYNVREGMNGIFYRDLKVKTAVPIPLSATGVVANWGSVTGTSLEKLKTSTTFDEVTHADEFPLNVADCKQIGDTVELSFAIENASIHSQAQGNESSTYDYLDTIEVDFFAYMLQDGGAKEVSYGDSQVSSTILGSSLWLQPENTKDNQDHTQWLLESVVEKYSNGIECLEITCTLGEDIYSRYQRVMPYLSTRNGIVPYSVDKFGQPKQYIVIGQKYSDDGHPTKKLYLQEYKN